MIRNRRDDAWVFHSDLIRVFLFCRNVPLVKKIGSKISFGDIFRIERHSFKVAFEPVETKVAYRVICGGDVKLRPREVDGSDTVINDDAPGGIVSAGDMTGPVSYDGPGSDMAPPSQSDQSLLCEESVEAILQDADVDNNDEGMDLNQ